jgi:hypothetical protein
VQIEGINQNLHFSRFGRRNVGTVVFILSVITSLTACDGFTRIERRELVGKYENSSNQIVSLKGDGTAEVIFSDLEGHTATWFLDKKYNYVHLNVCYTRINTIKCPDKDVQTINFGTYRIKGNVIFRITDKEADQFTQIFKAP